MSITLINGTSITKNYEKLPETLAMLQQRQLQLRIQQQVVNETSEYAYKLFQDLRDDYNNKIIDKGIYWQQLNSMKSYFSNNEAPYPEKLKANTILDEMEKLELWQRK